MDGLTGPEGQKREYDPNDLIRRGMGSPYSGNIKFFEETASPKHEKRFSLFFVVIIACVVCVAVASWVYLG